MKSLFNCCCVGVVLSTLCLVTGCGGSPAGAPSKDEVTQFMEENPDIVAESRAAEAKDREERNTEAVIPR